MRWLRIILGTSLGAAVAGVVWTRRGMRWGARPDEIADRGTVEQWFEGVPGRRQRMTRATTIAATPEAVWPWLAQMGRGAGWYSHDRLDNGGRPSARHLVGWIPEPHVGDALSIGYLRRIEPGRELVYWGPGVRFLGARTWSSWQYTATGEGPAHTRVVMRVDASAAGACRWLVVTLFPVIDSVMAIRQLSALKERVERHGTRRDDPENPETGTRDQYQLHHVIYAAGGEAGVPGVEGAGESRDAAIRDGVVHGPGCGAGRV